MNRIFILAITSFALISCMTKNYNDLDGEWIATGYNCEDRTGLTETIKIIQQDSTFYAIKLTGDNCIGKGDTTWYGTVINDEIIGFAKAMNPNTREIELIPCTVYENSGILTLEAYSMKILTMERIN